MSGFQSARQVTPALHAPIRRAADRASLLAETQIDEGFDFRGIEFYRAMIGNEPGMYVAEITVLALRMSQWAIDGTPPDWRILQSR